MHDALAPAILLAVDVFARAILARVASRARSRFVSDEAVLLASLLPIDDVANVSLLPAALTRLRVGEEAEFAHLDDDAAALAAAERTDEKDVFRSDVNNKLWSCLILRSRRRREKTY